MSFADSNREGFGNRKGGGSGGGGGGGGGGGISGGDAGSSGAFAAQASVARANIAQLLSNINTVQRLSSALGSPKDTVELRERLHHVIEETKLLCADSKAVVKDLSEMSRGGYQGGGPASQREKIEARKLGDELAKALQRFQEVVRGALHKEREFVAKAKRSSAGEGAVAGAGGFDEGDGERTGLLERERAQQIRFVQEDTDLQFSEALIVEREQGIREIERSVNDVNEIFRDLAVLVKVQGQDLDDIESGIVRTGEETEQAVSELTKAAANQKRARRTLFCLLTVLLLVGILVVLIITKAI